MSSKRNHSPNSKHVICNKCGATAKSVAGKRHRRCPGQMEAAPRAKHDGIAPKDRGRWG